MIHSFQQKYKWSVGARKSSDIETIQTIIDDCVKVTKSGVVEDKRGVDYIATLKNGAEVLIDVKARERGAKKFWRRGRPEFPLETWSVLPGGKYNTPLGRSKVGWTLSTSSSVDYILFTFDPSDCNTSYMVPFQWLRTAFVRHLDDWKSLYKTKPQESCQDGTYWESQCVFVPDTEVYKAMTAISMYFDVVQLALVTA